jgi:hypothetical protein
MEYCPYNQRLKKVVRDCWVHRNFECYSDHRLVAIELDLVNRKHCLLSNKEQRGRRHRQRADEEVHTASKPKALNFSQLGSDACLRLRVGEEIDRLIESSETQWEQMSFEELDKCLAEVCRRVIPVKEKEKEQDKDWFDRSNVHIKNLLKERRDACKKWRRSRSKKHKRAYRDTKSVVQKAIRQMHNMFLMEEGDKLKEDDEAHNTKSYYEAAKKAFGHSYNGGEAANGLPTELYAKSVGDQ